MRPPIVFANAPAASVEDLQAELRGRWRQATRAVMVLLSLHGLPAAQIAGLLGYDPGTVRRWIARFNRYGVAGLADRPRPGRPRRGGRRLIERIAALLARPGPWTIPRLWRMLNRPALSRRTLYRRVRLVAIWRRPKLIAKGDPDRWRICSTSPPGYGRCRAGQWCGLPMRPTSTGCRTCGRAGRCARTAQKSSHRARTGRSPCSARWR
jgi:transposase